MEGFAIGSIHALKATVPNLISFSPDIFTMDEIMDEKHSQSSGNLRYALSDVSPNCLHRSHVLDIGSILFMSYMSSVLYCLDLTTMYV